MTEFDIDFQLLDELEKDQKLNEVSVEKDSSKQKESNRDNEKESNRDSNKDNERDSNKDNERDSSRDNERESSRDNEKESNRDSSRDNEKESNRDSNRDNERDSNRDSNRESNNEKPREYSSNVLKRLNSFLIEHKYMIVDTYSFDDVCVYLKLLSQNRGYNIILSIPSKYSIEKDINSIILQQIEKCDITKEKENIYDKINEDDLIDENKYLDPKEIDKLLDNYTSIDIDKDLRCIIQEESQIIKSQLNRLSNCTFDLKYKICIETDLCFCIINNKNHIKCYSVDKKIKDETKKMYITIDMENFYESIHKISNDYDKIENNLYKILDTTHSRQVILIKRYLNSFNKISNNIDTIYGKKNKYLSAIHSIKDKIKNIEKKENEILIKLSRETNTVSELKTEYQTNNTIQVKKLKTDAIKIHQMKEEAISILSNLKINYDHFVLEFESTLIDNIDLLKQVADNFEKIGIKRK